MAGVLIDSNWRLGRALGRSKLRNSKNRKNLTELCAIDFRFQNASMGKGHKDRRREQRAREIGEREADESLSKDETDPQVEEDQLVKKPAEEIVQPEKSIETCRSKLLMFGDVELTERFAASASDTDSGHGSSTTTTSSESPKAIQSSEPTEHLKRRSLIKGLQNIGNTCFFNVIIQVMGPRRRSVLFRLIL